MKFIDEKLTQLNITLVEVKADEVKAQNILELDSHENGHQRKNEISKEKNSGKKDMKEEVEIPTKKMKKDTYLDTKHKKLNGTSKSNKDSKIKISLYDDRVCPVSNNKTDVDEVFIEGLREDRNTLKKKKLATVSISGKKLKYNLDGKGFPSKAKSKGETKEEPIFLSRTVKIFKIASVDNAENHETQKIEKQAKKIKKQRKSKFSSVKFPASSHGDDQPIGLATSNDNVIDRKERSFNPVVRILA